MADSLDKSGVHYEFDIGGYADRQSVLQQNMTTITSFKMLLYYWQKHFETVNNIATKQGPARQYT